MARATPENYTSPRTIDNGDDQNDDEDASKIMETASTLLALHNVPFPFSSKAVAAKAINRSTNASKVASKRIGKSRFCRQRQQVKDNELICVDQTPDETALESQQVDENEVMCLDQNVNEAFDASKAILIHIKDDSSLPQVHNMAGEPMKLFSDEELKGMLNIVKVEDDFMEVICACTSKMHGDYVGNLRVFRDGKLQINCKCTPGCDLENATPEQFVSHASAKRGPSEWPSCIWIHDAVGNKTKIQNTPLLRYFEIAGMKVEKRVRFKMHRDEFLKCSKCGAERRFRLRSGEECRMYHDAELMKDSWTCSMHPGLKTIECGSEGERASRMLVRGCTRQGTCIGCSSCVCCGCNQCRFSDCGCQVCVDFTGRT